MAKNNLNSVSLSGNLTADAELRYTNNGTVITTFTLAVNRTYGEKGEASFFDVKIFGKLGEAIKTWLTKGKPVIVGGRLSQERWEQDGQNRSKVLIVADFVELLQGGQGQGQGQARQQGTGYTAPTYTPPSYSAPRGPEAFGDDEIPF